MLRLRIIIIQVDLVNSYKLIIKKMEWYMGKYLIIKICMLITCYNFFLLNNYLKFYSVLQLLRGFAVSITNLNTNNLYIFYF